MNIPKFAPLFFAGYILHLAAGAENITAANLQPVIAVETVALSNDPIVYAQGFPGTVTRTISSNDKIIFYYAALRVVNPGPQKIEVKIECVDSDGKEVISKKSLYEVPDITMSKYFDGKSGYIETSFGLNPASNVLVAGQKMPLKNEAEYYIRLIVNGKLFGLTKFRYFVDKKMPSKK